MKEMTISHEETVDYNMYSMVVTVIRFSTQSLVQKRPWVNLVLQKLLQ